MEQYINKSAVVAEIEKIREHVKRLRYAVDANCIVTARNSCECLESSIDLLVNSINTLEVKALDEEYIGKAMLHILEKGVKQGKRELIDKACEWLDDNLHHYWGRISADPHNFLFDFRKAMEE